MQNIQKLLPQTSLLFIYDVTYGIQCIGANVFQSPSLLLTLSAEC